MQTEVANPDRVLVITRMFDAPRALLSNAGPSPSIWFDGGGPTATRRRSARVSRKVGDPYRFLMRAADGREVWVARRNSRDGRTRAHRMDLQRSSGLMARW